MNGIVKNEIVLILMKALLMMKPINIDESRVDDLISTTKPLTYHVYDDKRVILFQNCIPLFYKIYNVPAVRMHKMSKAVSGTLRAIFTGTIIL